MLIHVTLAALAVWAALLTANAPSALKIARKVVGVDFTSFPV